MSFSNTNMEGRKAYNVQPFWAAAGMTQAKMHCDIPGIPEGVVVGEVVVSDWALTATATAVINKSVLENICLVADCA